jgi:predicted HAD superfamily Cof-like phosphohydrolase
MSKDWVKDIHDMQTKYQTRDWVDQNSDKHIQFLNFRADFLQEELDETKRAIMAGDPEEIVDGLIDLCVVAIGTLDAFDVDAYKAWDEVLKANMAKQVGVKESRPNPLGMPDLIKPEGWKAPNHEKNYGCLPNDIR